MAEPKVVTTDSEVESALKGAKLREQGPLATTVEHIHDPNLLIVKLSNHRRLVLLVEYLEGLDKAAHEQMQNYDLLGHGTGISFPDIVVDLYVQHDRRIRKPTLNRAPVIKGGEAKTKAKRRAFKLEVPRSEDLQKRCHCCSFGMELRMIVGDTNIFAIESEISVAYERLSHRALGFFALHIGGRCYGVRDWNATMLACSFDDVGRRIEGRGTHIANSIANADAKSLARAFSRCTYMEHEDQELFVGMQEHLFRHLIDSNRLVWAPDGDEAFDDSSCVLQVDIGSDVRLVAFSRASDNYLDPGSLRDVRLSQEEFYGILQYWEKAFVKEWELLAKADGTIPHVQ